MNNKVRVWDLPTRVFHWSLVFCVVSLVITAEKGGDAMNWHFRLGYAVIALLLFRLVWGLVGGRWSRFSSFLYSPGTVLRYLRGQRLPEHDVGHSPLAAGSVFAMLLFLMLQVATGLFSDDEISATGPFASLVANKFVSAASFYHTTIGQPVLYVLVALHLCAILYYQYRKRKSLIAPMIVGDKLLEQDVPASRDDGVSRTVAAVVFAVCVALVLLMLRFAP